MKIELIIVLIISIPVIAYGLYLLSNMPSEIMQLMEEDVERCIEKQNKEYEEKDELYKELRSWLLK